MAPLQGRVRMTQSAESVDVLGLYHPRSLERCACRCHEAVPAQDDGDE